MLAAEGVYLRVKDGAGDKEVFCGAINVQIKHEMYLKGLCPCVFVDQSASRFWGRAVLHLPPPHPRGFLQDPNKLLITLNTGSGLN